MATPLKDQFDREAVEELAERFSRFHAGFEQEQFTASVLEEFPELELKERVNLVADRLADELPDDYPTALSIVMQAAAGGLDGWAAWPLCSFVERHGVDSPAESLEAMPVLTKLWTCEFAIRPFLNTHLGMTRDHLRRWVLDPDEAVRRLCSEGTRPLLPWGTRVPVLIDDPQIGIELLSALRHDDSEIVRRSVANHLNDITKSRPDLVVDLLDEWMSDSDPVDERMVSQALRTLVKQGHPGALHLLGFTTDPQVDVSHFSCEPETLNLGSAIELTAELTSTSPEEQLLVIDFVVHHVTGSGGTSPKVFKWATLRLAPGETVRLSKRRRIRTASTRRYHAGRHRIDLQVAGRVLATTDFDLKESSPPS